MEQSDITLNPAAFDAATVLPQVSTANEQIKELGVQTPPWWEVGAQKYRDMRRNGETPWPKPAILDGTPVQVPSREGGRTIPIRIMKPDKNVKIKSVIMYIHGGGWVLMAEDLYDSLIKQIANETDSLVVSVGYRLAPENPWPAGSDDCNDVADWLVDNAMKEYGASLQFIGGDSAGGNLTMTTYIHLHSSRPQHHLSGLINYYGCYDLSRVPSARCYDNNVVLTQDILAHYLEAYCPGMTTEELKNPALSPLYQDFRGFTLPPAIFLCGTNDPLLDDSAFMHVKWLMAGGKAVAKFYPGVPHGFMSFPAEMMPPQAQGMEITCAFVRENMR